MNSMDNQFVKELKAELNSLKKEKEKLLSERELIKSLDIPEDTKILEKLEKEKWSRVSISVDVDGVIEGFSSEYLNYKDQHIFILESYYDRIFNLEDVVSITNIETDEVIFENKFIDETPAMKKALLFGKKYGLEYLDEQENSIIARGEGISFAIEQETKPKAPKDAGRS